MRNAQKKVTQSIMNLLTEVSLERNVQLAFAGSVLIALLGLTLDLAGCRPHATPPLPIIYTQNQG